MKTGTKKFLAAAAVIAACALSFVIVKLVEIPDAVMISVNENGVVAQWEPMSEALYYNVYKKTADGPWELAAQGLTDTYFEDTDVIPRETYTYSVQAYLTSGIKSAFNVDEENAFVYAEMSVLDSAKNTGDGVYITWEQVTDAVSYIIYRRTAADDSWQELSAGIEETGYTDTEADPGTTYYYTVMAVYEDGSYGTMNSEGISILYLAAPVMESAEAEDDLIEVLWEASDGACSYIVYRALEEDGELEELSKTDETFYEDTDVEDGLEYYYAVCAVSESGEVSALSADTVSALYSKPAEKTSASASASSSSSSASSSSSSVVSPVSDDEPYVRASGYYQITYSISYSGGYDLSTSNYNMGLKVIKVKEYLVDQGLLTKTWDKATDAWTLYDSDTAAAVSKFQTNSGLEATGVVDEETWLAMGFSESDWTSLGAYVTPIKVDSSSTRSDYIEAMISTAESYLNAGTTYGGGCSGSPGSAVDCSGLIIQCLYAAGINPTSVTVITHSQSTHLYGSRDLGNDSKLGITVSSPERGDLVFYYNSSGVISHVAIYVGDGYVIESQSYKGVIKRSMWSSGSRHKYVRVFW